jgi:hypothetical protein
VSYQCATCGEIHDDLPDVAFRWPDPYFDVPESERAARTQGTSDTCVIDDEHFFVRGVILVPILGGSDQFGLGVWVSQKRENFQTYLDNFDTPEIGPFFGWLSNRIAFYERDTFLLKTMVHFQGMNQRPLIELQASDHPLYLDYAKGISMDKVWNIIHARSGGVRG